MPFDNNVPKHRPLYCWYAPKRLAQSFADINAPRWFIEAAANGGPWYQWSPEIQVYFHNTFDRCLDIMKSTAASSTYQARRDCRAWYTATTPNNRYLFGRELRNKVLQCERCGLFYDHKLRRITRAPGLPIVQMSFAFCPANGNNRCNQDQRPDWIRGMDNIDKHYKDVILETMRALSKLNPDSLIRSVLPNEATPALLPEGGLSELRRGYKALRVLWIRAFTGPKPVTPKKAWKYAPDVPTPAEAPVGRQIPAHIAEKYRSLGSPSHWGDIDYDLQLLDESLINDEDLTYLYGMHVDALRWITAHDWELERELLNAYAGMRQRVDEDHYRLMRIACQRANTAMERVLATKNAGLKITDGFEHLYAFNGVRFRELLSALCADLETHRSGNRALDKPVWADAWKNATISHKGQRVYAPQVTGLRGFRASK
ncbi:hypothetical protein A9K55_006309 [Cordyceps militaris]|uniref:Uncharacterized protein n=1 Tax=Cordyceps militaris TaxID=73501 RepID=A0A2H4SAG8_CORMI|nr:hypothetical protein A9K55_006309 [Cordyceps militaris]